MNIFIQEAGQYPGQLSRLSYPHATTISLPLRNFQSSKKVHRCPRGESKGVDSFGIIKKDMPVFVQLREDLKPKSFQVN